MHKNIYTKQNPDGVHFILELITSPKSHTKTAECSTKLGSVGVQQGAWKKSHTVFMPAGCATASECENGSPDSLINVEYG